MTTSQQHRPFSMITLSLSLSLSGCFAHCLLDASLMYIDAICSGMQKKRDIIPLMLEEGYDADGWLGLLLGTSLWYGLFGHRCEKRHFGSHL
jgi:hypothetical protein